MGVSLASEIWHTNQKASEENVLTWKEDWVDPISFHFPVLYVVTRVVKKTPRHWEEEFTYVQIDESSGLNESLIID